MDFSKLDAEEIIGRVLESSSFYDILGVEKGNFSLELLRRQYIKLSRKIHPDKLPNNPRATEAFQKLSNAYETLKEPSSRSKYDLYGDSVHADANVTFEELVRQMFSQFAEGNFESVLQFVDKINAEDPSLNIDREAIKEVLKDTARVFEKVDKRYIAAQSNFSEFAEIYSTMQAMSYFDVGGRFTCFLKMTKVLFQLPRKMDIELPSIAAKGIDLCIASIDNTLAFPDFMHRVLSYMYATFTYYTTFSSPEKAE
eukprot:Nk52_evm25s1444 gene=Nk52_evmTU25s1444